MKTRLSLCLAVLIFLAILVSSCLDDTSSIDSMDTPGVTIDTTGMPQITALQFGELKVEPNIDMHGVSEAALSYKWQINIQPGDTVYQVVGQERNLDYTVKLSPNISQDQPYQLLYTITNENTDVKTIIDWPLQIKSSFGEGLAVADRNSAGAEADLSLIKSPRVTPDYSNSTTLRNIYSRANNGEHISASIKTMQHSELYSDAQGKIVPSLLCLTDQSITQVNTLSYVNSGENDDLFFKYAHEFEFKPETLGKLKSNTIYVDNNRMYATYLGSTGKYNLPLDYSYAVPSHIAVYGVYLVAIPINFYDETNDQFIYVEQAREMMPVPTPPDSVDYDFDPANLPGKVNVKAAWSDKVKGFEHLLRDENTGELDLYLLNGGGRVSGQTGTQPPSPKAIFKMDDAPQIARAKHFVLPPNQKLVYYATDETIYAMIFSGSNKVYQQRFTVPAGETITTLQLYEQVGYPWSDGPYISTNQRQLIMSTYDGSEGKVYLLPITNLGVGLIDKDNIQTFGGFRRITSVAPVK